MQWIDILVKESKFEFNSQKSLFFNKPHLSEEAEQDS